MRTELNRKKPNQRRPKGKSILEFGLDDNVGDVGY